MVRGLRKYLTPFAPDQSGAVSLLYELGGMVVILDAGGCTGNICGFDEPRWSSERSAIFSAGLRDMDAIMGRDRALVEKIAGAQEKLQKNFIAIVGTPVPAVIGTDYQALRRMLEKRVSVPVLCIETNGMKSFEYGAEKAYLALISAFAITVEDKDNAVKPQNRAEAGKIGVFGTFPMTESDPREREWTQAEISDSLCFYGHGAGLEDYRLASENAWNLVTSVPGLAAAKALEKRFGTPYRVMHPSAGTLLERAWGRLSEKERKRYKESEDAASPVEVTFKFGDEKPQRILIVQEQVLGNSLREVLRHSFTSDGQTAASLEIHVMSFFKMLPEWMEAGDRFLTEESELWSLLQPAQSRDQNAEAASPEKASMETADSFETQPQDAGYDLILGDPVLKKMLPSDFTGCFLEIPEPAISGFPAPTAIGGQNA